MSRRNIQSGDLPNSVANAVSVAPILASNYVSGGNFDFAAACAAAIAANKPLYLGTGTLTASTQPYLTGGLHIYGDGPGLTTLNCSSANVALHFSGSLGTAVNVSSDVAAYQSTINVPTTGFAVGNKILLRSNAIWAPETQGNTSVHGELLTVASIVDSTHLTVDENIADTYLASDTASIAVVTMLEGVKVEGFKVVNPSPDSYINGFMDLLYCYMPIVRDVQTYFMDGPAFRAYTCWDPSYDVMVRESLDYALTSNTNLYHYGYGVQFVGACRAGQVNIRIDKGRHAFTTSGDANGIPRYTKISGHATRMTSISFDTHGSGEHVSFANCVAENSEWYGFQSRSPKTTFFNCKARGVQKYGMYIDVLAADCRIINCDVSDVLKNTFGNGIMTYGLRTLIMGGTVQDTDEESIVIQNGANDCTIIGTDTRRPGRVDNAYHIRATGTVTGLSAVNNVCRGTSSSSPSSYGYDIGPSVTSYLVDLPACQYVTNPSNIAANINSYFAPAGLTGATAISRYVGATTSGAPTTGSFAKGDYIIAQSGAIWICTSTGTPGSWTQVGGSSTTLGATTVLTASNATWSVPSGATVLKITAVGGGGGGGGGGAASSGIAQTGGSGGSAGVWVTRIVNIGDVTLLAITIGSGGSAGSAGASGGGAGGNGVAGGTTTITNANGTTAISVKGNPGGRGTGSGASSTTNVISAAYGGSTPPTVAFGLAGSGGQSGTVGGAPNGFSGSGGGGGGTASATLGGSGGSGGSGDTAGAAGTTAGSGTSAGTAGTAGATNTGSGGGGGGGGTAGSGAGGIGGIGGTGIVIIEVVG